MGQTANFLTNSTIPIEKFPTAVNSFLPKDIVIKSAEEMDERFHARYSARGKKYMYIINNSKIRSALDFYREYHINQELDYKKMKKELIKHLEKNTKNL